MRLCRASCQNFHHCRSSYKDPSPQQRMRQSHHFEVLGEVPRGRFLGGISLKSCWGLGFGASRAETQGVKTKASAKDVACMAHLGVHLWP